ncbi:MAG: hypothetical protein K2Y22_11345 [Candidatus Obscuribacterales bacterium]|nr:hypothetical protein [Candidatus Obscuribacterales bacterium]
MHNQKTVQLTIRNVPEQVKKLLSRRAKSDSISLNTALVEALCEAAGILPGGATHTDLDELSGRWNDDPEFDQAILAQQEIDHEMWQ